MIISQRAIEKRIKRANTDWWIGEKSVVGENGKTYIAYSTDMGEIHVKEWDARCSRALSRDVRVCRLNSNYADEHNSPALCILRDGKIMVFYTGHRASPNKPSELLYRVTGEPYDIGTFGEEHSVPFDGGVSYAQLFENTDRGQLWLFSRVGGKNWGFCHSEDGGKTFSKPKIIVRTETLGQTKLYYMQIRKIELPDGAKTREEWFFALYGHPRSNDHTIRSGIFDADGNLLTMAHEKVGFSLFDEKDEALPLETLSEVYSAPENTTVRLLEVSPTLPYRVGLATFSYAEPENTRNPIPQSITYHIARFDIDVWRLSSPIAGGGAFLSAEQTDGSETYVGGMACYYGVGDAGLSPKHGGYSFTDRVFLARFDRDAWALESYITHDGGENYRREQVIRRVPSDPSLPWQEQIKIWRPTVPIHAGDNLPVYWHEGTYAAHTGGWHSDVVTYIEYDD